MSEALAKGEVGAVSVSMDANNESEEARKAAQLPEPKGYKLLIALPEPEEMTEGGILKAATTLHDEEVGSIVGLVLKLGADAYNDPARFPSGPLCKEGDFILMRSYSGTRFKVHGKEFRLINDDSVEAVVEDPRGVLKI
jgi:co-chaperonin GroES (HSP10)|tara:strand:+ start:196 stop:612 length:417 start_codon:yes stop_codon:yes gene_type:complete